MLDYGSTPVVVIKWSDPPEHGSSDQERARKQFDVAMAKLQQELDTGGYIAGFNASNDYPTRYWVVVQRNVMPAYYVRGIDQVKQEFPAFNCSFD